MKAMVVVITLFFSSVICLKGQVLNAGFENVTPLGKVKNWVSFLSIPFQLGNPPDSLVVDSGFYFSTADAHTGLKALEMRNAYYYVSGQKFPGNAQLNLNDSVYMAFSSLVPIASILTDFSFYYKFFPANNDTAIAELTILDSSGLVLYTSSIDIFGLKSNYTLASQAILYSGTTTPAFFKIEFKTAKQGTIPNYGTRFLVDDISIGKTTKLNENTNSNSPLTAFPCPVNDNLQISLKTIIGKVITVYMIDAVGKIVKQLQTIASEEKLELDTKELKAGVYILKIELPEQNYVSKFIK